MVEETFYASNKHICIQCSDHRQKGRRQIEHIGFPHEIGRANCREVRNHSKIISRKQREGPSLEGNPFRLTEKHFLILIPPTDKSDKPTRRCIVPCKHEQRKESPY